MKKEIAEKWVEALRSGEYVQGRGQLNMHNKFCCLGVLCELATKEIPNEVEKRDHMFFQSYNGSSITLPIEVRKWAGITDLNGSYFYRKKYFNLADLNDVNKLSFKKIADRIEKHWDKL